jgi:hypothetical protein
MNETTTLVLIYAFVIFLFIIPFWIIIRREKRWEEEWELFDKLGLLARMHGLDFIDVLRNAPHSDENGAIKLEDAVDYIIKNSKRAV